MWSPFNRDASAIGSEIRTLGCEIYDAVSPAVVCINAVYESEDTLKLGSGSGFIFDTRGYIITNYHVIANATDLSVSLADQRTTSATVIAYEESGDLALLKIDLDNLPVATLGSSEDLKVGQLVFPIGNPGGEQFARSITMGIISGLGREMILSDGNLYSLIQTDAAINPGNSGGPLVDAYGKVIGVNSVKIVDADFEGMGFAIPIDTVRSFLADYVSL